LTSRYLVAPEAIQLAMIFASASPMFCAGMGIGPQTPAPPVLILPAK
jgi:hypothetical protein